MKERKYVKFRVDMYEDTKFKIIDMKPERDLIHYVWTRLITLAGKVNLEGDLYMSKNIPYTIETLAIEFNRSACQIKLAIEVFMELEMIELTENNIYRVKNFVKHQNIKVTEKAKCKDVEENVKKEINMKESHNSEISDVKIYDNETKECEEGNSFNSDLANLESKIKDDLKVNSKESVNIDVGNMDKAIESIDTEKINKDLHENSPIILDTKKNRRRNKNKEKSIISDEETKEDVICWVSEGEIQLAEGDRVLQKWAFN